MLRYGRFMPPTIPVLGRPCIAIVYAQLRVDGEARGIRPFVVYINDGKVMSNGVTARYADLSCEIQRQHIDSFEGSSLLAMEPRASTTPLHYSTTSVSPSQPCSATSTSPTHLMRTSWRPFGVFPSARSPLVPAPYPSYKSQHSSCSSTRSAARSADPVERTRPFLRFARSRPPSSMRPRRSTFCKRCTSV